MQNDDHDILNDHNDTQNEHKHFIQQLQTENQPPDMQNEAKDTQV